MYQDGQLGREGRSQQAREPKEIDTLKRTKAPEASCQALTQLGGTLVHPGDSRPLEWLSEGLSRPEHVNPKAPEENVDYFTLNFSGQNEPAHVCRQILGSKRTNTLYTDISGNITIYTLLGDLSG